MTSSNYQLGDCDYAAFVRDSGWDGMRSIRATVEYGVTDVDSAALAERGLSDAGLLDWCERQIGAEVV